MEECKKLGNMLINGSIINIDTTSVEDLEKLLKRMEKELSEHEKNVNRTLGIINNSKE